MKRGNNRFALYRTKDDPEGRRIRGKPYRELGPEKQYVNTDHYRRIYMGEYDGHESLKEIMARIKLLSKDALSKPVGIGDVLQISRDGEPLCYYIDEGSLILITKFILPSSGGAVIEDSSKDIVIEGKPGTWDTVDSTILDGRIYYLMENQKYKDTAGKAVLDADGKIILDNLPEGFDAGVIQQIREVVRQTVSSPAKEEGPAQTVQDKDMLIWQRPYENGTWERRAESGTEANYDMVDGRVNNPVPSLPSVRDSQTDFQGKPKRRKSVIRKLRKKQREIALNSGKPIPPYLQEERDRK